MLSTRLISGTLLVGALVAILVFDEWLAPYYPLWLVAALVILGLAAVELVRLLGWTEAQPSGTSVLAGTVALILANWAPHVLAELGRSDRPTELAYDPARPVDVMAWPLWAFTAVVMACFLAQAFQFRRPGRAMTTLAGTFLALAYVGLLGGFLIQLRWFDGPHHGLVPLAYLVATAKGSDIGAYTLGRLIGRRKLWPVLSPGKTVEGAIGGVLAGVLGSLAVTAACRHLVHCPALSWLASVGFGLLITPVAMLGDLMESLIKRDCEQKDASAAVPGFGGVLDVLDSLLFAAPVAYGFWVWFGP